MALSRIHLPSIALVLSSDQTSLPERSPAAIKSDSEALLKSSPSNPAHLMKTIDLRDEASFEGARFSYHILDDFATDDGHEDNNDAKTIFKGKRPGTSRGFHNDRSSSHKIKHTVTLIMSACRRLLPVKTAQPTSRKAALY